VKREARLVAGGLAVLAAAALPIDPHRVSDLERAVFRAINGGSELPAGGVWVVMQLGMIGVVPASALVALAFHRYRLAGALLLAGLVAYAGGKIVKRVVERGRPDQLFDDVTIQGAAAHGLGFVSGHAAVAFALATVLWPEVGARRARRALVVLLAVLAVLVALARVRVGAHLPLDVVGGAGLGIAAGGLARLAVRRPACS
jgi:undecaprenyl-diphosphatase